MTRGNDATWQRKIPIKFLKAVIEQQPQPLCESSYTDYDSCENVVSSNNAKKYFKHFLIDKIPNSYNNRIFFLIFSRNNNDLYEYNSEESNIDKINGEFSNIEEKRGYSRAGCDCQLFVRLSCSVLIIFKI